jgi:MoaA/NifB/PqqE/SkfB family radical SAM enzyme
MESKEVIVYQCHVAGIYKEEDGNLSEQGLSVIYQADSDDAACEAAARFLRNRCNALGLTPACVQVCKFCIRPLGDDGNCQTRAGFNFFEWKYDTSPNSFEDLLYSEVVRVTHRR